MTTPLFSTAPAAPATAPMPAASKLPPTRPGSTPPAPPVKSTAPSPATGKPYASSWSSYSYQTNPTPPKPTFNVTIDFPRLSTTELATVTEALDHLHAVHDEARFTSTFTWTDVVAVSLEDALSRARAKTGQLRIDKDPTIRSVEQAT